MSTLKTRSHGSIELTLNEKQNGLFLDMNDRESEWLDQEQVTALRDALDEALFAMRDAAAARVKPFKQGTIVSYNHSSCNIFVKTGADRDSWRGFKVDGSTPEGWSATVEMLDVNGELMPSNASRILAGGYED